MATAPPLPWSRNPEIVDLRDMDIFVQGVPHDKFKILRNKYPLYWNEGYANDTGFWVITKYHDIERISKDPKTFCSGKGINIHYPPEFDPQVHGALIGNMITMDPPMHTAFRKIGSPFFTTKAVAELEPLIRQMTAKILDEVAPRGECEFMSEVAARLPISLLCEIMGVPPSDHQKIFEWSNLLVGVDDPELVPNRLAAMPIFMQLFAYGQKMIKDRRANPRNDLMSAMANAKFDDMPVPSVLLDGFFLLMVIAGNETTRNTITGGMLALMENPDQRQILLDHPELIPTGVEEILRWVSPVMYMRRTATCDTELRGTKISEGDKVVMWYGAANRDEEIFENGDTFNVRRQPNEHIAFGVGQHLCLGMRLAQLQLRVMFTELLRRFPDMELAGPVRRLRSNFINGIKQMPVKFTPQK